jgi:DinB superfamily
VIIPDTKDWTWVIERPCPECGFDASACRAAQVATLVRENTAQWSGLLARGVITHVRPDDAIWSPLEYACHVRDVYRRYLGRIDLMLAEDDPLFANWDQDRTALEDDYAHQQPATVVGELVAAGGALAERLEEVSGATWERRGRRSDGAAFSLDTISRYMAHDVVHHVADVTR